MIDGGIDGWKSAGLKVVEGVIVRPTIQTVYEFLSPVDSSKSASLEDVKATIADDVVILDTRAYLESDELIQGDRLLIKGKIPGSYNIPWDMMVNKDKTFKSPKQIKAILDDEEITEDMPVILYSRSGEGSAHMIFVLKELLGYKDVKNYDGSWAQWSYESTQGNIGIEKDNIFKVLFSYITKREKLESVITILGVWGPLFYILIYIFITITILPALPITIVGGIIFGPIMGVVYTAIGAGIGLSLSFLIARYIARDVIERKFGNTDIFKKIDEGVKKDGWFILAVTRLIPIFPFGIQNYVYGLTSIGFVQYAILSTIFILPGSSVYVMLAGAFTSGGKATVLKYSITASLIFMSLMVVTKIIKKRMELQK
ncbi:VTT domain-containing protein [Psychrilyobacter sp.]|uniref:VTT domain-containing protein n=1 Tax=Psychrilyobacter sp. TaxID=2586924 RepID=UPI00301A1A87